MDVMHYSRTKWTASLQQKNPINPLTPTVAICVQL